MDASSLRQALRASRVTPISEEATLACLDLSRPGDVAFDRARREGLTSLTLAERSGLNRVTGEVAESVAEMVLVEAGLHVFWHITTPGVRGVDLLFLCPDDGVLALEVKGTLRGGSIPRLTPSKLRQMSREWLNGVNNPAMSEWGLKADDLYAGVMMLDFALMSWRLAVSGDFTSFLAVDELTALSAILSLFRS